MIERARGRRAVEDRARIMRRDKGMCQACLSFGRVTQAHQVDHIIALTNGGDDSDDNKRALCDECHAEKTRLDMGYRPRPAFDSSGLPMGNHRWNV